MKIFRVGILGCGMISRTYAKAAEKFQNFKIVACADLDPARARALAEEIGIPRAAEAEKLPLLPEVDVVLNLTIPSAHAATGLAALRAGKHVYLEKPLAVRRREARELMGLARDKGLRIGCAPDTFLGAGLQTCRKLLDDGAIGKPLAANAFMMSRGPESWHPAPEFFYEKGGGPLFDMGPYYLTALTTLLGPVRRVSGAAGIGLPERVIETGPAAGRKIRVKTPTHISASLDFLAGAIGTLVMSFEVAAHRCPCLEIHGEEGSLLLPDPNTFGGPVLLRTRAHKEWREIPLAFPHDTESRGLGLADMCAAIEEGRDHRASDRLAYHVLDIMHSILDSSETDRHVEMRSGAPRPAPMPAAGPSLEAA